MFPPEHFGLLESSSGGSSIAGLTTLPGVQVDDLLTIVRGDDYRYADDRAIVITKRSDETWLPFMEGDTITVTVAVPGTVKAYTATVITDLGDDQSFYIEIAAADFPTSAEGWFDAQLTTAGGSIQTLRLGAVRILRDITA